jgi:hypothetical protein
MKKLDKQPENHIASYDQSGSTRAFKDSKHKSISSVIQKQAYSEMQIEDQSSLSRSDVGLD